MTQKLTAHEKKEINKILDNWQINPFGFYKKMWDMELYQEGKEHTGNLIWQLQYDLIQAAAIAIRDNKQIFIGSGHGLGKDYICGAMATWFLYCFRPSIVLLTGPTDRQVKHTMYKEVLNHWNRRKVNLGGTPFANPRIEINKEHYLLGFTTKETGPTKEGGGGKFQSFHSPNMCIIVTEAQSVEDSIYDQIDACATAEKVLVIFLGNPTRAKGRFAKGLKDKSKNIVFNFSCLDSPNYKERRPAIPGVTSYQWVEDKRYKWGEGDPRWIGRVIGQVPANALNFVFTEELFKMAFAKHTQIAQYSANKGVAVDIAGEGVDDNVFMAGSGGEVIEKYKRTLMTPQETALKAFDMCRNIGGHFIIVDCDGMGIRDFQQMQAMKDLIPGVNLIKFHGSAPTGKHESQILSDGQDKQRPLYYNQRAEAAFIAQQRIKDGVCAINPNFKELIEDLDADEWFENRRGLIQLIEKEDIKELLERSPGCGDCFKMLQWAFSQEYADQRHDQDWRQPPGVIAGGTPRVLAGQRSRLTPVQSLMS